ncbi:MAG: acylphosphatase [Planctomycetota bacterium]
MSDTYQRTTVVYTGHVQGVGFRYTVRNLAERLAITGYVRNLDNGKVELLAEGPPSEIDSLLTQVRDHFRENIDDEQISTAAPSGQFATFAIRH